MRTFLAIVIFTASVGGAAHAQTAGTVFPNNQDPSATPAEQSMQQVGGPSDQIGVVVQEKVKPAPAHPKAAATHRRKTVVKTKSSSPPTSTAAPK